MCNNNVICRVRNDTNYLYDAKCVVSNGLEKWYLFLILT